MPVKQKTKSDPVSGQIVSRDVPRKSRRVPPAPSKYITEEDKNAYIEDLERLRKQKQEVIKNRQLYLASLLAASKAQASDTSTSAPKEADESPSTATKQPAVRGKRPSRVSKERAKRGELKGKPSRRDRTGSAAAPNPEVELKVVSAVSARVPRRLKEEPTRKRGRKTVEPPEEVVTLHTARPRRRSEPKRAPIEDETDSAPNSDPLEYVTLVGGIPQYEIDPNEPYMSENQLDHFRKLLLAQLAEHNEMIEKTLSGMQEEPTIQADPLDQAHQEAQVEIEMRTRERERRAIRKIQESISLIDEGRYGYCESCRDEIGIRRLEVRPTATKCIECKNIDEIEESRYN